MRTFLTSLAYAAIFGLVSCGGGNDVASTGATAVNAAASAATSPTTPAALAAAESTTAASLNAISEPKLNGQIDERTGVAPVAAKMAIAKKYCDTCSSCHAKVNLSFCPHLPITN